MMTPRKGKETEGTQAGRILFILQQDPATSDNSIAKALSCDHTTVAAWRAKFESQDLIPPATERRKSDGRTYTLRGTEIIPFPTAIPKPQAALADDFAISSSATIGTEITRYADPIAALFSEPRPSPSLRPELRYLQERVPKSGKGRDRHLGSWNVVARTFPLFRPYCKDYSDVPWERLTADFWIAILVWLRDYTEHTGNAASTIGTIIFPNVKGLAKFVWETMPDGPLSDRDLSRIQSVTPPKAGRKDFAPLLTVDQWIECHKRLDYGTDKGRMYAAFLCCMFPLGMRAADAGEFRVMHLNIGNQTIDLFRGKTGTQDYVMLEDFPNTTEVIRRWAAIAGEHGEYLWYAMPSGPSKGVVDWGAPIMDYNDVSRIFHLGLAREFPTFRTHSGRISFRTYCDGAHVPEALILRQGGWAGSASQGYSRGSVEWRRHGFANVKQFAEFDDRLGMLLAERDGST